MIVQSSRAIFLTAIKLRPVGIECVKPKITARKDDAHCNISIRAETKHRDSFSHSIDTNLQIDSLKRRPFAGDLKKRLPVWIYKSQFFEIIV